MKALVLPPILRQRRLRMPCLPLNCAALAAFWLATSLAAQTSPAPAPAPAPSARPAADSPPARMPEADDKLHEFTNQQGQKIEAEIVNVLAPEVILKRKDGQTFRVRTDIFVKADQDYIRRWAMAAARKRGGILDFSAVGAKTGSSTAKTESTTIVSWMAGYRVKIQNKSQVEFQNLRVDYAVFKLNAEVAATRTNEGAVVRTNGSATTAALKPGATFEFDTVKVDMDKQSLNAGWYYTTPGARNSATDDLLGVWIRVYDGKDLVQEWCSSVDLMKKEKW